MLQQPVTDNNAFETFYDEDHEVRRVRMNETHTRRWTQSWYGDSVGHTKADTMVIDTMEIQGSERRFRKRKVTARRSEESQVVEADTD